MQTRSLLVALLVLAGLGGYVAWSSNDEGEGDDEGLFPATRLDEVTALTIEHKDGSLRLGRDGFAWFIDGERQLPAEAGIAQLAAQAVLGVHGEALPAPGPPSHYGLAETAVVARLDLSSGDQYVLRVGNRSPVGSQTYVQAGDDPAVRLADAARLMPLQREFTEFRDKRVLPLDGAPPIDALSVRGAHGQDAVELRRDEGGWRYAEGWRADSKRVEALLSELRGLRALSYPADVEPVWGTTVELRAGELRASVTIDGGSDEPLLRVDGDALPPGLRGEVSRIDGAPELGSVGSLHDLRLFPEAVPAAIWTVGEVQRELRADSPDASVATWVSDLSSLEGTLPGDPPTDLEPVGTVAAGSWTVQLFRGGDRGWARLPGEPAPRQLDERTFDALLAPPDPGSQPDVDPGRP